MWMDRFPVPERVLSRVLPSVFTVMSIMTFWADLILSMEELNQCLEISEVKAYPSFQNIWIIIPRAAHVTHSSACKLETTDGKTPY